MCIVIVLMFRLAPIGFKIFGAPLERLVFMPSRMTVALEDVDGDIKSFSIDGTAFAGDGSNYTAVLAAQNALRDAILAVTLGAVKSQALGGNYSLVNAPRPTDPNCQATIQFRLVYQDDVTGDEYTVRIPTADLDQTVLLSNGISQFRGLDISTGLGGTLAGAWSGYALSPNGNASTLIAAVYVQ
jgi:hypothetical protein